MIQNILEIIRTLIHEKLKSQMPVKIVGVRVGVAGVVGFWKAGVGVGSRSRGFLKRPESESESKFTNPETTPSPSLILFEIYRLDLIDFRKATKQNFTI